MYRSYVNMRTGGIERCRRKCQFDTVLSVLPFWLKPSTSHNFSPPARPGSGTPGKN